MATQETITTIELKRLILQLEDQSPDTKIRLQVSGLMWDEDFSEIIYVTAHDAMIVRDGRMGGLRLIPITDVAQFELAHRFKNFKEKHRYKVCVPLKNNNQ